MDNTRPFVTVGIIARNEEKNIGNTLSYLISQSYPHNSYEIIIVDGNSTDKTRETADKILSDSGISFKIINEAQEEKDEKGASYGHSFARNMALKHMSTDTRYIAWIDADCRADVDWLGSLISIMEEQSDNSIAGAGGRRLVETQGTDITAKELMLNYYFTSKIMSLGNPAFTESDTIYMPSIAGYNSIYKAEVIRKYGYDTTYPFNTDDIEINYRLTRDGYRFLNAKNAKIWHRMDESITVFLKQMIRYGKGAMDTSKIHKKIVRLYIPISIIYILGIILTPIFLTMGGVLAMIIVGGWSLVFLLTIIVFIENISQTKSAQSLWVFVLVPLHPLMYGYGVMKGLFSGKKPN